MKTVNYNPSPIEVMCAQIITEMTDQINKKLDGYTITKIENNIKKDNPTVDILMKDKDGDEHEVVIKIIQKPDK
jgi:hypothetical protein